MLSYLGVPRKGASLQTLRRLTTAGVGHEEEEEDGDGFVDVPKDRLMELIKYESMVMGTMRPSKLTVNNLKEFSEQPSDESHLRSAQVRRRQRPRIPSPPPSKRFAAVHYPSSPPESFARPSVSTPVSKPGFQLRVPLSGAHGTMFYVLYEYEYFTTFNSGCTSWVT